MAGMGRCLLIFIALVWMAGVGAFFLYVPLLSVVSVGLVISGFAIMFIVGFHVGSVASIETEILERTERHSTPRTNSAPAERVA
jgi:hypothetical protein